jgi:hypothetical protein
MMKEGGAVKKKHGQKTGRMAVYSCVKGNLSRVYNGNTNSSTFIPFTVSERIGA